MKPKVIHLFEHGAISKEDMIKNFENMIAEVKAGNIIRYVVAAELKDGTVATGYTNADLIQKQVFISHLQLDIMWAVTMANLFD